MNVDWSGSAGLGAVSIGVTSPVAVLIVALAIAGLVWPIWGAVRWKRGWRLAALVPIAALSLAAAKGAYDSARSPGSINVSSVYVFLTAFVAGFYMITVALVRRFRRP